MFATRRIVPIAMIAIALLLSQFIVQKPVNVVDVAGGDSLDWTATGDGSEELQGLIPVQNISMQVKVPPGKSFYIYFDEESETLKAMRVPDETAGLAPEAVAAIQRSPAWIQEDLARMLGRLSELQIDPSPINDFTAPEFADMDADGAVDLVLGDMSGTLTLYRNVDPALHYSEGHDSYIAAVFVKDDSFFPPSLEPGGSGYGVPAIGDLNGDNLPDIAIGGGNGRVYVFENMGPPSSPTWTAKGMVGTISAGTNAAPAFGDLDGDGDMDLMVGSGSGFLYSSINTGANPHYITDGDPTTVTTPLWSAATTLDVGITSYSSPALADMDGDGKVEMATGDGGGWARLFRQSGSLWAQEPGVFAGFSALSRSAPALIDLDMDNLYDLVLGSTAGNLRFYANVGSSGSPSFMYWQNYTTGYSYINFNQYYYDANSVFLTHRNATSRLIQYSDIINNAPQEMVDEIAFSIAKANAASLLNPSTFPEVYLNNTDALYFNSQYTSYAQIMDYNLGTPDQWSTVRYVVNESGTLNWYEYPRDVYYWWLVSLKGTDELATFINPTIMVAGHEGARNQSAGGVFWRWAAFNLASATYPPDPAPYYYPKEETPPILRTKITNATVLWNDTQYKVGRLYNDTGYFYRDPGGNITRPWNMTDQAVEIVLHWVSATVPLDAQRGADPNRPRQPVRIQWEHNGNCGELSDTMWSSFRSALIPARGVCGYGGDHCWAEFYDRGWHHIDSNWDAYDNTVNNSDAYHYGWNRDWSGIMAVRGDGLDIDVVDHYHKAWNASNDIRYPPESHGLVDRANVTIHVTDANGNPLDGVKVTVGDYRYLGTSWLSFGTQWTFTDAEGNARFYTSEARQNWNLTNPNSGDSFDDGIGVYAISKLGSNELGTSYPNRLKPSYGDAYNPRNAPMHYYNFTLSGTLPRPALPVNEVTLPPRGIYTLNLSFDVDGANQHPAVAVRWNEGLAYHDYEVPTGHRVTSFFTNEDNFASYLGWESFDASNMSYNTSGETMSLGIPPGGDWYFVLSNPGVLETTQLVNFTATLLLPEPENRDLTITASMIGKRLMSIPIRPIDTDITYVFGSCLGNVEYVRWYDPKDALDPWKSYVPGRQYNTLTHIDETMGFWVSFSNPCSWTIAGYPAESTAIQVHTGWNLVGFPSNTTTYTVGDLKADIGVPGIRVEAFDPTCPPYNLRVVPDSITLSALDGYWVMMPNDSTWILNV